MSSFLGLLRRRRQQKTDKNGLPRLPDTGLPLAADATRPSPVSSPHATVESAFFQKLPSELRRRVLIAAFGARTVHMNLALETLPPKRERPQAVLEAHRRGQHRHAATPRRFNGDDTLPQEWKWRSSVCHSGCFDHRYWTMEEAPRGPAPLEREDDCLAGDASCDFFTDIPPPEGCFIGVLGWLFTCRQAYLEGVDVLYATNTIRLHGTHIFYNLPKLIAQPRLADISTVSLFWDLGVPGFCGKYRIPQEFIGLEGLETLVQMLPASLPGVRRLHLSLFGFWWQDLQLRARGRRSEEMYRATEDLLQTIVTSVVKLQSLVDCRISLPFSIYQPWVEEAANTTAASDDAAVQTLWRELPLGTGLIGQKEASITGYWVHNGVQDLPKEQLFGNY